VPEPLLVAVGGLVRDEDLPHLGLVEHDPFGHPRLFVRLKQGLPSRCSSDASSATVSRIIRENSVSSVRTF
jgi:hypothetical protein